MYRIICPVCDQSEVEWTDQWVIRSSLYINKSGSSRTVINVCQRITGLQSNPLRKNEGVDESWSTVLCSLIPLRLYKEVS